MPSGHRNLGAVGIVVLVGWDVGDCVILDEGNDELESVLSTILSVVERLAVGDVTGELVGVSSDTDWPWKQLFWLGSH